MTRSRTSRWPAGELGGESQQESMEGCASYLDHYRSHTSVSTKRLPTQEGKVQGQTQFEGKPPAVPLSLVDLASFGILMPLQRCFLASHGDILHMSPYHCSPAHLHRTVLGLGKGQARHTYHRHDRPRGAPLSPRPTHTHIPITHLTGAGQGIAWREEGYACMHVHWARDRDEV